MSFIQIWIKLLLLLRKKQKSPLISAADDGIWPLIPFPQVPPSCERQVAPLRAEIQALNEVIDDQQRYIQELHKNHVRQLQQIPSSHLGAGNVHRGGRQTAAPCDTRVTLNERILKADEFLLSWLHVVTHGQCPDCSDVFADGNVASGVYVIRPDGSPTALKVFCDMNNGGGWTVFQRRRDGTENFDRCVCCCAEYRRMLSTPVFGERLWSLCVCRAWVEYKHGFGDMFSPEGEFWLGNEPLHYLTSQGVFFHLLHILYQKSAFYSQSGDLFGNILAVHTTLMDCLKVNIWFYGWGQSWV